MVEFWQICLAAVILLPLAFLSLLGHRMTMREIKKGRVSYDSLADYAGEWGRKDLARIVGTEPDAEGLYEVSAETLAKIERPFWKKIFDNPAFDGFAVLFAFSSVVLYRYAPTATASALGVLILYELAGWVITAYHVFKFGNFTKYQPEGEGASEPNTGD